MNFLNYWSKENKERRRIKTLSLEECNKEIASMIEAYRRKYPNMKSPFLVGSSLEGNPLGDSEYYWKLIERTNRLLSK